MILSLILLWCLVLPGLEPLDDLLKSPPEEHFLRCLFANAFLLAVLISIEPELHTLSQCERLSE